MSVLSRQDWRANFHPFRAYETRVDYRRDHDFTPLPYHSAVPRDLKSNLAGTDVSVSS